PGWSVSQIKSALVLTGDPVFSDSSRAAEVATTREGGGLVDLPKADKPLVFAQPSGLSFGLLQPRRSATRTIQLADAGGRVGPWTVPVALQRSATGVTVSAPTSVTVPGTLQVKATVAAGAEEADVTGFVVLTRGPDTRRLPFWLRSERPRLAKPTATLKKQGV